MARSTAPRAFVSGLLWGFVAGFVATLTFQQIGIGILHWAHIAPPPYPMTPVAPFRVPQIISLAFWGGVWGIVFVLFERPIVRSLGYWVGAVLFGAILPTLVFWFVVLPLKDLPVGFGFHWPGVMVPPIADGLWGFGTALFLVMLPSHHPRLG